MPEIIALTGYAQSGKDEAAKVLAEYGYEKVSFAEPIRKALLTLDPIVHDGLRVSDILDVMSYDAAKTQYPEYRRLLQVFGTEVAREQWADSFWVDLAFAGMESDGLYVITDCRFPNEAAAVRDHGGHIWRIQRHGVGPVNGHASDNLIDSIAVDITIKNDDSLAGFQRNVRSAFRNLVY